MVKRYAITMDASFMKKRPKDHVRPSRHSRAKAPRTQDLKTPAEKHAGVRTALSSEPFSNCEDDEFDLMPPQILKTLDTTFRI